MDTSILLVAFLAVALGVNIISKLYTNKTSSGFLPLFIMTNGIGPSV